MLDTDRLVLRQLTIQDTEFIFELLNEPSAITVKNNHSCIKLLKKLGFERKGTTVLAGSIKALELYERKLL